MFKINGKILYESLAYLDKVIEEDCVVPALSSYLIIPENGNLRMIASDTQTTITVNVFAITEDENRPFLIDAKLFTRTMKEMPNENIEFQVTETNINYKWSTGNGSLGIMADTEPYPVPATTEGTHKKFTLSASQLSSSLGHVMYAASRDEARPNINGVYFSFSPNMVSIAATDQKLLAFDELYGISSEEDAYFTLANKPASILKKITSKFPGTTEIEILYTVKEVHFYISQYEISIRTPSEKFPNYKSLIPSPASPACVMAVVDKGKLLTMIRRVAANCNTLTNDITLRLSDETLAASSTDLDTSSFTDDRIDCSYFGEPVTTKLLAKKLIPALENFPCNNIELYLNEEGKPLMLRSGEDKDENCNSITIIATLANS